MNPASRRMSAPTMRMIRRMALPRAGMRRERGAAFESGANEKPGPNWARHVKLNKRTASGRHCLPQVLVDLVEEAGGRQPLLVGADQEREVLGHEARLDRVHRDLLERRGELSQCRVVVELGAVAEAARPGKDRGDRVGRGLVALLVLA